MSFAIILSALAIPILMALILSPHLGYSSPSTPTNSNGGNEIEEVFTTTSNSSSSSTASSMAHFNQTEAEIIPVKNPIVSILTNELETRINKSGAILEITSRLPQVKSAPYASSISPEFMDYPKM